jgi:DNA invertase Pin-like site-specific DNA recombinase
MEAQLHAIEIEVGRRGWAPACIYSEIASGKTTHGRPMLAAALESLDRGEVNTLVVAKLDRLARSVLDFAQIMARAKQRGWAVVCLDIAVDTSTATGKLLLNTVANFADFEREVISERTRNALTAARARGVKLGRPRSLPNDTRQRIFAEWDEGRSLRSIAHDLMAEGVPTAQGGARWHAATIRKIVQGYLADELGAIARTPDEAMSR